MVYIDHINVIGITKSLMMQFGKEIEQISSLSYSIPSIRFQPKGLHSPGAWIMENTRSFYTRPKFFFSKCRIEHIVVTDNNRDLHQSLFSLGVFIRKIAEAFGFPESRFFEVICSAIICFVSVMGPFSDKESPCDSTCQNLS